MTAKEKLATYVMTMRSEGLISYSLAIKGLLEHLSDDGVDMDEHGQ